MSFESTVTLSSTASRIVQARIDSGEFEDARAVIDAALDDGKVDDNIEVWLKEVVAPTYDALEAGTMKTYSADEVAERLAQHAANFDRKTAAA